VTNILGQRGAWDDRSELCQSRQRNISRSIGKSGFGRPSRPSRTNQYTGLLFLDYFDITKAFSVTGGGRFNIANIIACKTRSGTSLNGNDTYTRFNPIVGGTYKIIPGLTAYAGYSEATVADSVGTRCADPAHPCVIATFLVWTPRCKQVVFSARWKPLSWNKDLNYRRSDGSLRSIARITTTTPGNSRPVCRDLVFSRTSVRRVPKAWKRKSILKSSKTSLYASYNTLWTRGFSRPDARLQQPAWPTSTETSRSCPATRIPAIPRNRIKPESTFDQRRDQSRRGHVVRQPAFCGERLPIRHRNAWLRGLQPACLLSRSTKHSRSCACR